MQNLHLYVPGLCISVTLKKFFVTTKKASLNSSVYVSLSIQKWPQGGGYSAPPANERALSKILPPGATSNILI